MRLSRVLAVVALLSGLLASAAEVPAQELTLRVARIPFGQGFVPVTQYMLEQKLVEKAGSQLGLNLKVDWKDFPSGRPIVDGLVAGQLDLGTVGFVPTTVALAQKAPIHVLANAEGRVKFYLVVPAGSPVRQVSDLRGKTIGMIIGTDMHVFLNRMLDLELGTADYGQLGIKLQALQTSAQLANPPKGIDASASTEPRT
jgi:ABC-type nitrate/sulfonate/bicarbonate transport system substrate-binding protein